MVMYNRHRRVKRMTTTQQFVLRKGLVVGRPVDSKDAVSGDCLNLVPRDTHLWRSAGNELMFMILDRCSMGDAQCLDSDQ